MLRALGLFLAIAVLTPLVHASGGGSVNVTHDLVRVTLETPRKIPMRGDEGAWAKQVDDWEKATQPTAEKVVAAIERVLPRYRRLGLVPKKFDEYQYKDISTEGVTSGGGYDDTLWRLTIDIDLYPDGSNSSSAVFVFKTRPSKKDIRAFSNDVRAAVLKTVNRKLPAPFVYSMYWLSDDSLLLTAVPIARLTETLDKLRWHPMGLDTFRRSPVLIITTTGRKTITSNGAGFLLANATGAKVGTDTVELQANGTYSPALTYQKATRADVLALFKTEVAEKERFADDAEFLTTLSLAK